MRTTRRKSGLGDLRTALNGHWKIVKPIYAFTDRRGDWQTLHNRHRDYRQ